MKNTSAARLSALAFFLVALSACGESYPKSEGNMYEKMAIFSLIALSAFALMAISFSGSAGSPQREDAGKHDSPRPLTAQELTDYPVYARDSETSFHKIVFKPDGTFLASSPVTSNGVDPLTAPAGSWALADGKVLIILASTGAAIVHACVWREEATATAQIQADPGHVYTWYFGLHGLANVQTSCFGHAAAPPSNELRNRTGEEERT